MTPRSLFTIFLKLLGILCIKDIIYSIPDVITYAIAIPEYGSTGIGYFVGAILVLAICTGLCYFLLFKTDVIINKLKLDNHFEEEQFSFNIHRSTILSIAIILLGGYILILEIPLICRGIYYFWRSRQLYSADGFDSSGVVISAAKIIIGLLLLGNQQKIVNYIEYRRKR